MVKGHLDEAASGFLVMVSIEDPQHFIPAPFLSLGMTTGLWRAATLSVFKAHHDPLSLEP